ncbi:MAG: macro domain-containing protein [Eubacterium sp.]|nr:macro domain-containing protein [Eubacterium sp.]
MPFNIIRNDITKIKADAIVNTANPHVAIGSGVDFAIYNAAGKDRLLAARKEIGEMPPGTVAVTEAFDLDAKYIIHVSGPAWNNGDSGESDCLRTCYRQALNMAAKNNCQSIAFPLLATGTYAFPKELGLQIAIESFTEFLEEHEMNIILVVFEQDSVKISGKIFGDVKSFVDDQYVDAILKEEGVYHNARMLGSVAEFPRAGRRSALSRNTVVLEDEEIDEDDAVPAQSLDDELKSIYTDSFEKHLQQLINKKGLKNSEVYATANISKQYFSKLMKGQIKPSKEKMLALAVGLRLNLDETVDFLKIAGYALSPISQTDKIVEYFIRNKDYNVLKIDIVLFDYGLDSLSGY